MVSVGDAVERGQIIAAAAKGLSVPIHASVSGKVTKVGGGEITLTVS